MTPSGLLTFANVNERTIRVSFWRETLVKFTYAGDALSLGVPHARGTPLRGRTVPAHPPKAGDGDDEKEYIYAY